MSLLWFIVYWGNLILGSGVIKFFQFYWLSGHFSVKSRIKFALKKLLIMIVAVLGLFAVFVAIGFMLFKEKFTDLFYSGILVMSNAYSMLVLVILLSYGLVFMPFSIWKHSSNEKMVYEKLMRAD